MRTVTGGGKLSKIAEPLSCLFVSLAPNSAGRRTEMKPLILWLAGVPIVGIIGLKLFGII